MREVRTPPGRSPASDGRVAEAVAAVRDRAESLTEGALDALAAAASDSAYVLIGEASHGTAEFYAWRARLTARLVRDHGFDFVAVEGDWPDCYEINRYVNGDSAADSAREVLDAYDRWPTWMWANWETVGADDVTTVGFGTHRGTVVAADHWGAQMERMTLPPAGSGSLEDVFHRADVGDVLLRFDRRDETRPGGTVGDDDPLAEPRGHRAVGVVYHPSYEGGNYVPTVLPDRYDAFVFVDRTGALHPLHLEPEGASEPETYPWGL